MQLSDILPRLLQTFGYNELQTNYVRYRYEAHHRKIGLKIFVVTIPKGMTVVDTDFKIYSVKPADYKSTVSDISKEGLSGQQQ